mgnify:CR=1 FL=1
MSNKRFVSVSLGRYWRVQYEELRKAKKTNARSFAEFVRRALQHYLQSYNSKEAKK